MQVVWETKVNKDVLNWSEHLEFKFIAGNERSHVCLGPSCYSERTSWSILKSCKRVWILFRDKSSLYYLLASPFCLLREWPFWNATWSWSLFLSVSLSRLAHFSALWWASWLASSSGLCSCLGLCLLGLWRNSVYIDNAISSSAGSCLGHVCMLKRKDLRPLFLAVVLVNVEHGTQIRMLIGFLISKVMRWVMTNEMVRVLIIRVVSLDGVKFFLGSLANSLLWIISHYVALVTAAVGAWMPHIFVAQNGGWFYITLREQTIDKIVVFWGLAVIIHVTLRLRLRIRDRVLRLRSVEICSVERRWAKGALFVVAAMQAHVLLLIAFSTIAV